MAVTKIKAPVGASHEDYFRSDAVALPSNRSFGLVFAAAMAALALLGGWRRGFERPAVWLTAAAALGFLGCALLAPRALAPLNRVWLRLGLLLHSVTSPVALGLLFYLVVTPLGLFARLLGKDFLRLQRNPGARTFWLNRPDAGSTAVSLRRQF